MEKSELREAVQKTWQHEATLKFFFIEYEGGFGAPEIECAIVKLAFSLG